MECIYLINIDNYNNYEYFASLDCKCKLCSILNKSIETISTIEQENYNDNIVNTIIHELLTSYSKYNDIIT